MKRFIIKTIIPADLNIPVCKSCGSKLRDGACARCKETHAQPKVLTEAQEFREPRWR